MCFQFSGPYGPCCNYFSSQQPQTLRKQWGMAVPNKTLSTKAGLGQDLAPQAVVCLATCIYTMPLQFTQHVSRSHHQWAVGHF